MSKTTLSVTDSFGETFTRTTARAYQFVVVTRADEKRITSAKANLADLELRREEMGDAGVAATIAVYEALGVKADEAREAGDWKTARDLRDRQYALGREARIDENITRARKDVEDAIDAAAEARVIGVKWTSRYDLAMKESAKQEPYGTVVILPII